MSISVLCVGVCWPIINFPRCVVMLTPAESGMLTISHNPSFHHYLALFHLLEFFFFLKFFPLLPLICMQVFFLSQTNYLNNFCLVALKIKQFLS